MKPCEETVQAGDVKEIKVSSLSLTELCRSVTEIAETPESEHDLDLFDVLRQLQTVPLGAHTADSAEALLQLTRIPSVREAEMLKAASLAAQVAIQINDRSKLSRARFKQALALIRFGRLSEATVAQTEAWSVACQLNDRKLELQTIWGFSTLSVALGHWNAAIRFCERMRVLAQDLGLVREEFIARNNLSDCALQLGDAALALSTLSKLAEDAPHAGLDPNDRTHLHNNLARAYLHVGNVTLASQHVNEAARWSAVWGERRMVHCVQALQGLVDVRMGIVESGLAAVQEALDFAKRANHADLLNSLGICIDAYEAAGRFDEALAHLEELVEWKKRSVDAEIARHFQSLPEALDLQRSASTVEPGLLTKGHRLRVEVQSQIDRLLEVAINAEVASGHDLYRPFRLGNLASHLAETIGWEQARVRAVALGAQLSNIGMVAIPARILFKPGTLSEGERRILHGHTEYGAELLRKSKLQIVETAAVIAAQHHEQYDGCGFPAGLAGEAISEEARLVAICDAFDAMTHRRPHRRTPLSFETALDEIRQAAGHQFDPHLVTTFVQLIQRELPRHREFDAFLSEGANEVEYVRVRAQMDAVIMNGKGPAA